MFGYIKPLAGELKIREFELYKSFYCGLCKAAGKKISPFFRIALSYDMVFLVLLRVALAGEKIESVPFRCFLNPAKKRRYAKAGESMIYSSCVAAYLSWRKCMDDAADAKGRLKKFFFGVSPLTLFFSRLKKKALKLYPELEAQIEPPLSRLSGLEKAKCKSMDETASCFAELMQNVASFGIKGEEGEKTAKIIGWHLGRWLYSVDAIDDFDKDLKKGEYNPLVECCGDKNSLISDIDLLKSSLASSLGEMRSAFCSFASMSPASCIEPIILNIINLGLPHQQEKILGKHTCINE